VTFGGGAHGGGGELPTSWASCFP